MESEIREKRYNLLIDVSIICISIFGLIVIGSKNYLIFHAINEMFGIVIGMNILIIVANNYISTKNKLFMFLSLGVGFVTIFRFMHILSFKGIMMLPGSSENLTVQYSLVVTYVEVIVWLIVVMSICKEINIKIISVVFSVFSILLILSINVWCIFPNCFIEGIGPTIFMITNEYILFFLFIAIIFAFIKNKKHFHSTVRNYMIIAMICNICCEVNFAFSYNLYGVQFIVGHIFGIVSYYYVYKIVSETSLRKPYRLLFFELSRANDELKIKTRQLEKINKQLKLEINEREYIEEVLKERETRYRKVMELFPDAIMLHKNHKIIYGNEAALELLDINDLENFIGKNIIDFIYDDYKSIANERILLAEKEGKICSFIEEKLIRKDGTLATVEISVTSFPYNDKIMMTIARDITEKKKIEENKRLLDETFNYDRLRKEFFANLSHELRTPINVIFSAIQLIELYTNESNGEEQNVNVLRNIKIMKQNCYRLLRLVNNLIDITRIDSGFYELNSINVDIVSLVEDIVMSVVQYASNKSIEILFDTNVEEKIMAVDPDKIDRILLNLMSNAVKFTEAGGKIKVTLYDKGDTVKLSVKDTGAGIPKDKLNIIFERFRQVDKSLARRQEGSGIGLSLVKSLVEMHQGKISVNSKYGEGSEFIVELPVTIIDDNEATFSHVIEQENIQKINIEFSDIYS